jgi:hypothetical protein
MRPATCQPPAVGSTLNGIEAARAACSLAGVSGTGQAMGAELTR